MIRSITTRDLALFGLLFIGLLAAFSNAPLHADDAALLERMGRGPGLCVLIEPESETAAFLAEEGGWTVAAVLEDADALDTARKDASQRGLLGVSIFVISPTEEGLPLASNLVDVLYAESPASSLSENSDWFRTVRPLGKMLLGERTCVKPMPEEADDWTHPYHGPDNNPQSTDGIAKAPYRTHFLTGPYYVPFPTVTVVSGGRLFKAMGNVGYKEREHEWVETLAVFNAYNGTLLWRRNLQPGFNIHRNTMIATRDVLYLADNNSCKILDAATGELLDEIVAPEDASGPVWKWMALSDGVLYALVGEPEFQDVSLRSNRTQPGWPWRPMTPGYDEPTCPWGEGRTFLAIDVKSKEILWSREESEAIDNRALCMKDGRIYAYAQESYLECLDVETGETVWSVDTPELLSAIGEDDHAQTHTRGFSTQAYLCCDENVLYFAGPQRKKLVAAATEDGRMLWQHPQGNFEMVLRDGLAYAMARTEPDGRSKVFEPMTGRIIREIPMIRGNCTRATGTIDSIFTRGPEHGGTLRLSVPDLENERIALMRPPCMDGVLATGGLLHWGPWMCDCSLSLVGNIALAPVDPEEIGAADPLEDRLVQMFNITATRPAFDASTVGDVAPNWSGYRGDNTRACRLPVVVASDAQQAWTLTTPDGVKSTAPVSLAGTTYLGASDGSVSAIDTSTGEQQWRTFTGGAIQYPPAIDGGQCFVGSCDGWVYALDAATGSLNWRFRAAPLERLIPVHGQLMSTWPVAGGVLVDNGVVYAAAGIASYDGTYVYALDAATGEVVWENDSSGALGGDSGTTGVSLQGHLLLHNDTLYLAGGNVVSPAAYEIKTGECLSTPPPGWSAKSPRGRELFVAGNEVHVFDRLLYSPEHYWQGRYFSQRAFAIQTEEETIRIAGSPLGNQLTCVARGQEGPRWVNAQFALIEAVAVSENAVLVAGSLRNGANAPGRVSDRPDSVGFGGARPTDGPTPLERYAVAAFDLESGERLWGQRLPASPLPWGLALDAQGGAMLTLQSGDVIRWE
jgi:outer membrane protein assembly factor BamB